MLCISKHLYYLTFNWKCKVKNFTCLVDKMHIWVANLHQYSENQECQWSSWKKKNVIEEVCPKCFIKWKLKLKANWNHLLCFEVHYILPPKCKKPLIKKLSLFYGKRYYSEYTFVSWITVTYFLLFHFNLRLICSTSSPLRIGMDVSELRPM